MKSYLWEQIRGSELLVFVGFDPETNVCAEIIKTLKIEYYYHMDYTEMSVEYHTAQGLVE